MSTVPAILTPNMISVTRSWRSPHSRREHGRFSQSTSDGSGGREACRSSGALDRPPSLLCSCNGLPSAICTK